MANRDDFVPLLRLWMVAAILSATASPFAWAEPLLTPRGGHFSDLTAMRPVSVICRDPQAPRRSRELPVARADRERPARACPADSKAAFVVYELEAESVSGAPQPEQQKGGRSSE